MTNNRLSKSKSASEIAKTTIYDGVLVKDELFNTKAKNQDICISHFQIYLINKGNTEDPMTYAKTYKLLNHDEYNYLAYLIADENDFVINYYINNEVKHYGKRNLMESYYVLRNLIHLDLALKTYLKEIDELLTHVFLSHDYLHGDLDISLKDGVLSVSMLETCVHSLLIPIFKIYDVKDFEFNETNYRHLKVDDRDLYLLDLNSIRDKINIYY